MEKFESEASSTEVLYAEKIVWGPVYPIAGLMAVIGIFQLFDQWSVGAILLGGAGLALWFSTARYTVTKRGVDVYVGAGHPHIHVSTKDIAFVRPTRLSLGTAGGWGYRGSNSKANHRAVSARL